MHDPASAATAEQLGLGQSFSFSIACWPVYQMLCGMSLELLLKAVVVAQGQEPQVTHDLSLLSQQAGLAPSSQQFALFKLLSGSIVWNGRYPVPKLEKHFTEYEELSRQVLFDEKPIGKLKILQPNGELKWEAFYELWGLANARYHEASS